MTSIQRLGIARSRIKKENSRDQWGRAGKIQRPDKLSLSFINRISPLLNVRFCRIVYNAPRIRSPVVHL